MEGWINDVIKLKIEDFVSLAIPLNWLPQQLPTEPRDYVMGKIYFFLLFYFI